MSWLIFDAVLGIVLVLAAVQGYRKGFVLTLCGFLAVFVAFFGASVLSNALAGPVAEAIRPVVEERLEQAMQKSLEEQGWSDGEVSSRRTVPRPLPLRISSPWSRCWS